MPDAMDRVQQHAQDLTADALDAPARRPRPLGLAFCEDEACGEPVSPERQALGARLCLDCQHATEARATKFGTGRRG